MSPRIWCDYNNFQRLTVLLVGGVTVGNVGIYTDGIVGIYTGGVVVERITDPLRYLELGLEDFL